MSEKVLVSGGFDPLHHGHIDLFEGASELGDELIVLVNNDIWLQAKKDFHLMPQSERMGVIHQLPVVDTVLITGHDESRIKQPTGMSICDELRYIQPDIFANGGDRGKGQVPEYTVCEELGIEMVYGVGGDKEASSSEMFNSALKQLLEGYQDNIEDLVEDYCEDV